MNWVAASGHPATRFGKSENEAGFLISMRKKLNGFTFFGWADVFWQLYNENKCQQFTFIQVFFKNKH